MQVSDRILPRVVEIATEALHSEKNILMVAGPAGAGGAMSNELDVLDKMNKQEKERIIL